MGVVAAAMRHQLVGAQPVGRIDRATERSPLRVRRDRDGDALVRLDPTDAKHKLARAVARQHVVTASLDGVTIRKDGLFTLDELKPLNPENFV